MRVAFAMVLVTSALLSALAGAPPARAADCQFVLGFKALHDLIPAIVGDCRTDEYHGANGDGLQETVASAGKGGLLVWRKADNWTAFTDGYWTWVNGPQGLQKRLNTERFAWEYDDRPKASTRAEILSYLAWGYTKAVVMAGTVRAVSDLLGVANVNPMVIYDAQWKSQVLSGLAAIRTMGLEMQHYPYGPVPADLQEVDRLYGSIGQDMVYAADETKAAVDNVDGRRLGNALARLALVRPKLTAIVEQLGVLKAKYSL